MELLSNLLIDKLVELILSIFIFGIEQMFHST